MRFSSMRYLTREGFRNIWHNRFMAIASVGVLISCLFLTGGAYLIYVNINDAFEWANKQNVVVAFAKEECTDEQTQALMDKIEGITNVDSVEFISKETAFQKYKDYVPEATYEDMQGEKNPLLDSYVITFDDLSKFNSTVVQIKQILEIDSVTYNEDTAEQLTIIRHIIFVVSVWIIGIQLLVSLFIIANTIKLTVYNRRLEISIMKSVGATNAFVRIPFIIEGMVLGLIAGGIAYGLIYFVYNQISDMFNFGIMTGLVNFSTVWYIVLTGFLGIGILMGIAGSAISIGKYLKNEGGISSVL